MSFNPKSQMYKIPMTAQELMIANLDDIFEQAKTPNMDERLEVLFTFETIEMPEQFIKIFNDYSNDPVEIAAHLGEADYDNDLTTSLTKPDMSRKPKHLTEAKYALQEGFFEEGERNEACMILAATYRYLGYNKELAYNMIKATLRLRAERLNLPDYDRSSLWKEVINPVFSPTWKGGTFSEDSGVLKKVIDRYGLNKINTFSHELISLDNVSDFFKDFAINIDKNTLKIGIEDVDKQVRITTGMLVTLLAAPSAGKSSIAMSILNTVSKNDCKCLFFSLDMSMQQTYQRLIQKHTGHQSDDIFEAYKQGNDEITSEYTSVLKDEYRNVKFSFRSGLTVDTIREMIITEQTITGIIPKLVVIDYLECIHGQFSDPTANKALIATQLKDIANQFNTCVLLLVQPRLAAGGPAGELNSYTDIKGSSVLGEASAVVLTLSRPGFNPKDRTLDRFATITVVKNRMGTLSSTDLSWEGITGNVGTLNEDGHRDLADLRSQLANQQESDEAYAGRTSGFKPFKSKPKGDVF
jgi:KaiC/GvpD/RAD55 family RecA-like ATPase